MDIRNDPAALIGSSCRLPGGVTRPSQLWEALLSGNEEIFTASPPASRLLDGQSLFDTDRVGKAGFLGAEGVEYFDASFFNITPAEAQVLRPNTRLALELTWEALESAGIRPSALRGKNVSVTIGVGAEDGWDLKRYSDEGIGAFDGHWAASSDPSGVSGRISHFFDFHGSCNVVSTACSSAAFALRDGVSSLYSEECEVAIVGAVTTHFFAAPFGWAASVNVASKRGRCSAFSEEADGYVPSEGAVFFVLTKASVAKLNGYPILGLVKSVATGHNGATRALATPNVIAQEALARRALRAAGLRASDLIMVEAHGTGTRLGDAMESEAIRRVFDEESRDDSPLWLSSSKTLFGHCQAAAAFVGILKVLECFEHSALPPHLVPPLAEYQEGAVRIPTELTPIDKSRTFTAQISSFGFTGSLASVILEAPPKPPPVTPCEVVSRSHKYIIPFSAKSQTALTAQMKAVSEWARTTVCSLYELGAILSLAREHHHVRRCVVISDINELHRLCDNSSTLSGFETTAPADSHEANDTSGLFDYEEIRDSLSAENNPVIEHLVSDKQYLWAAALLYELGHEIHFEVVYDLKSVHRLRALLQTLPTYAFERKLCWKTSTGRALGVTASVDDIKSNQQPSRQRRAFQSSSPERVAEIVGAILNVPPENLSRTISIFDVGIDSLNSIELAATLTRTFGVRLTSIDLYSLVTIDALDAYLSRNAKVVEVTPSFSQSDVDAWVEELSAPIIHALDSRSTQGLNSGKVVLLTGANGMLGCHVLNRLILRPEVSQIFCLVRGDAWSRLCAAYSKHGYDSAQLETEEKTTRLVVHSTSDLGDELLGCSKSHYDSLAESVDTIIHNAWRLDFNLAVPGFQSSLQAVRNLAELCAITRRQVNYHFISSYASYFGYNETLVPEEPLMPNLAFCLDQGYAISKLIAEHALISIAKNQPSLFKLNIIRVGQICGNSVTGNWAQDEMVPMIIKSVHALRAVLLNVPDVSWIPSDVCASAICDLISSESSAPVTVRHIANPSIIPWIDAVRMIEQLTGITPLPLLPDGEYTKLIQQSTTPLPISRLLPYMLSVLDRGGLPTCFASLEVKETAKFSPSLASCPKIDIEFFRPIIRYLLGDDIPMSVEPLAPPTPVLLFGPWSIMGPGTVPYTSFAQINDRVHAFASNVRAQIDYTAPNHALSCQLNSLATQLSAVEEFSTRSIQPCAVLGYCFGEYAAAITAGILSEQAAVEVLVRRAAVLHNVSGSMLNVFAELSLVKRLLLKASNPPDIAIFAGPKHIVLSGSDIQINEADEVFQSHGVKAKIVQTSIPFHSSVMDGPVKNLHLSAFTTQPGKCLYVSGITGGAIDGRKLGGKYWTRHMRDHLQFLPAMQYLQKNFAGPFVDIGPGPDLTSMLSRYKWDNIQVLRISEFLMSYSSIRPILDGRPKPSSATSPAAVTPVPLPTAKASSDGTDLQSAALDVLGSLFGYPRSEDLLSKSFLSLGLQSLDFVRFSDKFREDTGVSVPASSFASDSPIAVIVGSLLSS